ncbi:MAG: DNA repair helicase [Bacteroidetes bacterium HGW-Bacteroidetes-1]|jgi:RNA polymerase primary sigma factor|nr:MAG: DNA repair helicase [Bacteroidetes bacterium HGW-Bacteroidetes-1]
MENRMILLQALAAILESKPSMDKYQLQKQLKFNGSGDFTTSNINSVLYGNHTVFVRNDRTLPLWSLRKGLSNKSVSLLSSNLQFVNLVFYKGFTPRAWQTEALSAWISQGRKGIIEAVTGTGKSLVGVLAAADAIAREHKVLIIVPGIELQKQWEKLILEHLPSVSWGKFGNGYQSTFNEVDIIISTIHSARRYQMLSEPFKGLLIADEVHGYGTEESRKAFESEFSERLGLTATYERNDNGLEEYVTPFFTPILQHSASKTVIAGCDYARGLHDGILAPFRVGLLGVPFAPDEDELYESLENSLSKKRSDLIYLHGCQAEPFGEFIRDVHQLGQGGHKNYAGTKCARSYLNLFQERKELLANSQFKLRTFRFLIPMINAANKCLVFTGFIDTAMKISEMLNSYNITAVAFSSKLNRAERMNYMNDFKNGKLKALAAPMILDEGIDVPEADLGIILSANHSKRQMIQRMGRIIRKKSDGRPATFFIVYIQNSNEDPHSGAHESFLTEMIDHADELRDFGNSYDAAEFLDWYIDGKLGR